MKYLIFVVDCVFVALTICVLCTISYIAEAIVNPTYNFLAGVLVLATFFIASFFTYKLSNQLAKQKKLPVNEPTNSTDSF